MNGNRKSILLISILAIITIFSLVYFSTIKPKIDRADNTHVSSLNLKLENTTDVTETLLTTLASSVALDSLSDKNSPSNYKSDSSSESSNKTNDETNGDNMNASNSDSNKESLIIGFVPLVEQDKLIDSLEPLTKLLSNSINKDVKAFTATNYVGVIEALGSGQVDFALLPPLAYVLAHQESNAELLLSAINKEGKSSYRSQFIVKNNNKINSVEDMKNKIIGFVDPSSSSGYVYPAAFLKKNGFDLDSDIQTIFCGGHDAAIEQLLQGDVDIACTYDDVRKKMLKDYPNILEDTKILAYSEEIPYIALVASNKLDKQTKDIIKSTFLNKFNDGEGKNILSDLFNLYGFKESSDSDYDGIRNVSKLMDIKVDE